MAEISGIEIKCAYDKIVEIKDLKPHPKNPNKHSKEQIERLAKIVEYQGIRRPVRVSKLSGFITAGHGLVAAIKFLGLKDVPVNFQDYENEDQEYADIIADNSIASWADLDLASINLEVPSLGPDFDIDLLGFKDFEIEPADKYGDKDADELPAQRSTDIKLGDLFILGRHRLLCGDATVNSSIFTLMNGEKADMVYTDPPYGIGFESTFTKVDNKYLGKTIKQNQFKMLHGDDGGKNYDPTFIFKFFDYCYEIFLWGADNYCWHLPKEGGWICWDKTGGNENLDNMPGSSFELCWTNKSHKRCIIPITWRGYFGHNKKDDGAKKVHPTMKPVKLHEWIFSKWGKDKANIVDLYLGSGSTLIACEKTNRKCFGMDIDPQYCQVIIDRWEKFTGQKSCKIESNALERKLKANGEQESSQEVEQGKSTTKKSRSATNSSRR